MSYTRTVNSCNPGAVTGKISNAVRDTGVCSQGEETVNFVAEDCLEVCVNTGAWRVESDEIEGKHLNLNHVKSLYKTFYICVEVNEVRACTQAHAHGGHHVEYTNLQLDDLESLVSAGVHPADYEQDTESLNPYQPQGSELSWVWPPQRREVTSRHHNCSITPCTTIICSYRSIHPTCVAVWQYLWLLYFFFCLFVCWYFTSSHPTFSLLQHIIFTFSITLTKQREKQPNES